MSIRPMFLACCYAATLCLFACGGGDTGPANTRSTEPALNNTGAASNRERRPGTYMESIGETLAALPADTRVIEYPDRPELTEENLATIATKSGLQLLDLSGCSGLKDEAFASLTKLKSLRILRLSRAAIGDAAMGHLARLSSLEVLELNDNDEITDDGVSLLAGLPALKELRLGGCDAVTDRGVEHLAQVATLQLVDLSYCPRIGPAGIKNLLQGCPKLSDLILHHTTIGDEITDALDESAALERVDLRNCPKLSAEARTALRTRYPDIQFQLDP